MADMSSGSIVQKATFAQPTPPNVASESLIWIDTSKSPNRPKIYDSQTEAWIPTNTTATIVSQTRPEVQPGHIWFEPVKNGVNMYAASNNMWNFIQYLPNIPDSVVSVNMPSTGSNDDGGYGGWFTTSQEWPEFQARFDPSTQLASDEEMVLVDTNGNELEVLDASGNSPGDVLTFSTTLSKNSEYAIFGRTPNNNGRDEAYNASFSDTTSADGNLTLTDGYNSSRSNNKDADLIQHISEFGNINL